MTAAATPLGAGAGGASRTRGHALAGSLPWRHLDLSLVVALGSICGIGVLMVYSSTRQALASSGSDPHYYLKRQVLDLAIGGAVLVVTLAVDYRRWRDLAPLVYAGMCLALVAVVSPAGAKSKGHQAWFPLGSFQLQPSELAKIALILCLAAYASWSGRGPGRSDDEGELRTGKLIGVLIMAGIPMAL
ncbi:MAG TPA: FtsW/RodA/SpoVE family cell cycle protein, partial [Acidimicrobiales bacterium]